VEPVIGEVDSFGRALITLRVRRDAHAEEHDLTVWVDTGFTGDLVVPRDQIAQFGLVQSAEVMAELADGKQVLMSAFTCTVEWFGEQLVVEVIESERGFPLLGVDLLSGHRLIVDYRTKTLTIE
jgi:clan AA aspartic protease